MWWQNLMPCLTTKNTPVRMKAEDGSLQAVAVECSGLVECRLQPRQREAGGVGVDV